MFRIPKKTPPLWSTVDRHEVEPWVLDLMRYQTLTRNTAVSLTRDWRGASQGSRPSWERLMTWLTRLRGRYLSRFAFRTLVDAHLPGCQLACFWSPVCTTAHPAGANDTPWRNVAAWKAITRLAGQHPVIVHSVDDVLQYEEEVRHLTGEGIRRVHDADYISRMGRETRGLDHGQTKRVGDSDDLFVGPDTMKAVFVYATMVMQAALDILHGRIRRAFVAGRPPGHHAGRHGGTTMEDVEPGYGFCIVNYAAMAGAFLRHAAQHPVLRHERRRVVIIDFDVHHGNGTEEIVRRLGDQDLAYVSVHCARQDTFPGTGRSTTSPHILNLHNGERIVSQRWWTRDAFPRIRTFLQSFRPTYVILSAGFDASRDDPMQLGSYSSPFFEQITKDILGAVSGPPCRGRVLSIMEGGYIPSDVDQVATNVPANDSALDPLRLSIYHHLRGLRQLII